MKLVKSPFFLIGVGSIFCAIIIAVVGSFMNPSSSLINKYEKALNQDDDDLLEECYSEDVDSDVIDTAFASLKLTLELLELDEDEVDYQILIGKAVEEDLEAEAVDSTEEDNDDIESLKSIPAVFVIKEGDDVEYIYSAEYKIAIIDGKEYIYTGLE